MTFCSECCTVHTNFSNKCHQPFLRNVHTQSPNIIPTIIPSAQLTKIYRLNSESFKEFTVYSSISMTFASQQMVFTQRPSVSNNHQIPTDYFIFALTFCFGEDLTYTLESFRVIRVITVAKFDGISQNHPTPK